MNPILLSRKETVSPLTLIYNVAMATIPNLSEHDKKKKKNLVRSVDSKIGDFHLTVCELVNRDYYRDATFNEIVLVLDNFYVT